MTAKIITIEEPFTIGPMCGYWYKDTTRTTYGPVSCPHESCEVIAYQAGDRDMLMCRKHGLQEVAEDREYTGFAGGTCVWWRLTCGCQSVDESADLEAAR
jgi:hypothetical protein